MSSFNPATVRLECGVCPTLHPYIEEYEAGHEEQGRVVIYLEE